MAKIAPALGLMGDSSDTAAPGPPKLFAADVFRAHAFVSQFCGGFQRFSSFEILEDRLHNLFLKTMSLHWQIAGLDEHCWFGG